MAEEPDSPILASPREVRQRLDGIDDKIAGIDGKVDDLKVGQNSHTGMLMAPAGYIRDTDVRVEHLAERIGGQS